MRNETSEGERKRGGGRGRKGRKGRKGRRRDKREKKRRKGRRGREKGGGRNIEKKVTRGK